MLMLMMVMIYEQKQRTEQRFLCHLGVLFVCCAICTKFNLILKAKKRERESESELQLELHMKKMQTKNV